MINVTLTFDGKNHSFEFKNEKYVRILAGLEQIGVDFTVQKIGK